MVFNYLFELCDRMIVQHTPLIEKQTKHVGLLCIEQVLMWLCVYVQTVFQLTTGCLIVVALFHQ